MSLMNLLQSEDPAIQNGLLNFGLSLLQSKGNFGNAVGQAGVAGQLGARDFRRQQALMSRASLGDQLMQSQLDEEKLKVKERDAAARRKLEVDQYLQSLQPVQGINANQATGIAGPTPQAAAAIGKRPAIDPMQALRLLGPEGAKALFDAQNLGRPEVARTADTESGLQQLDKYGNPVGPALSRYTAPVQVNRGSSIDFVTPKSGISLPVGMSPEARDASSRGWANVNLSKQRLDMDRGSATAEAGGPGQAALVKTLGKPPKDYRWKADGSAEPIPGGPADIKAGEIGEKRDARNKAAVAQADAVLETVADAKKMVGYSTAGAGGLLANLPMSDARNLRAKLDTVKANLGFDRLQQMRESSPTGGALGAVAVQELMALQSTVASLDQLQSPKQLSDALTKIEGHYKRWQDTLGGATGGASGDFGKESKSNVMRFDAQGNRMP